MYHHNSTYAQPFPLLTHYECKLMDTFKQKRPMSEYEITDYLRHCIRKKRLINNVRNILAFTLLLITFYFIFAGAYAIWQ